MTGAILNIDGGHSLVNYDVFFSFEGGGGNLGSS